MTNSREFILDFTFSYINVKRLHLIFKAFNQVVHQALIRVLQETGIGEPLLSCFRFFIDGRKQSVNMHSAVRVYRLPSALICRSRSNWPCVIKGHSYIIIIKMRHAL